MLSSYDWLTKDREIIEKYENDKLCTFKFTLSAMVDLKKLLSLCSRIDWFKNISSDLPIFLISGDKDPVGNYGKGVKRVYELLKANVKNVELKLNPDCRHEIHNDTCKDEMFSDILNFLNED